MKKMIYALGFFDGVHLGHQALLRAGGELARASGCCLGAITFSQHPQSLFTPEPPRLLTDVPTRETLLKGFGVERVTVLPVTREVMTTPWETFLRTLLEQGAGGFVCGDDFRFGAGGDGDGEKLQTFCREQGLPCIRVPEQRLDGVRLSSTHIRSLLEAGEVEQANRFLGHPHLLTGRVTPGRQLGRTLGIPTANIPIPPQVVVPRRGVYAAVVTIDGRNYRAVTNVGSRPTVGGHEVRTESWILDYAGDLYGRELTLTFHRFLRPERTFPSLEALTEQIHRDGEMAASLEII